MPHHVGDVFFGPSGEYRTIAVGAFRLIAPVVESLDHEHDAHFFAQFHEFGCRHVVRSAHCVHSHFFQHFQLMAYGRTVNGGSERSEVMVHAHALEHGTFAIEVKSVVRSEIDRADAEACGVFIEQRAAFRIIQPGDGVVQYGSFRTPQLRIAHCDALRQGLPVEVIVGRISSSYIAAGVCDDGGYGEVLTSRGAFDGCLHAHGSAVGVHARRR